MKHRLIRVVAALAIALGAVAVPSGAATVQAGSKVCTGWTSTVTPPTTIRVYRHATRKVDVVPFRTYVETVMAAEWGPTNPPAALQAGAVAVKQYAWYWAINWRGKSDRKGNCYDVIDTTQDQLYDPKRTPSPSHLAAVRLTWWISLRKSTRFIMTGYRHGTGVCLGNLNKWHLFQSDSVDCIRDHGDSAESILRRFYIASVAAPGFRDATGDVKGDVVLAITDPDTGEVSTRILTSDPAFVSAPGMTRTRTGVRVPGGSATQRAVADVTGDGRVDLVQLDVTEGALTVRVMVATDTGFASARTWWSSTSNTMAIPPDDVRLVVGDFDADWRADVGLVSVTVGETPAATLFVARAASGATRFGGMRRHLQVAGDFSSARFLAADFSGDGRTDLAIIRDVPPAVPADPSPAEEPPPADPQTEILVAASVAVPGITGSPKWPTMAATRRWAVFDGGAAERRFLAGDVDRNGRDDLVVIASKPDGVALGAMTSTGTRFKAIQSLAPDQPFPWAGTQFVLSDIASDGRADLVALAAVRDEAAGDPAVDAWRWSMAAKQLADGTWVPVLQTRVRWLRSLPLDPETVTAH